MLTERHSQFLRIDGVSGEGVFDAFDDQPSSKELKSMKLKFTLYFLNGCY